MKFEIIIFLLTLNLLNSQVIINEFQAAPSSDDEEWIELYNNSDSSIVINNLSIWDLSGKKDIGKISFKPRELMLITSDTSKVKNKYYLSNVNLIQKSIPSQNNTYDAIFIKDENDKLLDSAYYDMSWGEKGKSFERFDPDSIGYSKNNWRVTKDSLGGTPCKSNSTSKIEFDLALSNLNLFKDSLTYLIKNEGKKDIVNTKLNIFIDLNKDNSFQQNELIYSQNIDFIKKGESLKFIISKNLIKDKISKSGYFYFKITIESDLDLRDYNNTLIGNEFISYVFGALQINEIMYESSQNYSDYIEIWNNSSDTINLNHWQFYNKSDETFNKTNKITLDIFLAPDSLFILAYDTTIYNKFSYLRESKSLYFSKSLVLNSLTKELFAFSDPNNFVIDSVLFDKNWHQQFLKESKDVSLEKIKSDKNSNLKSNWSSCIDEKGGTPLLQNSIKTVFKDTLDFYAEPNPFSPFSDGLKKTTKIFYKLPYKSANIILKLYDLNGVLLRTIMSGENTEQRNEIVFDGYNDNGSSLQVGAYILFLEATDKLSGEVYSKKLLIAIGK